MTLRLHRGALLSQRRTANGPPSGAYQPPTADSLALVFAGGPYAAPESGAIPLNFGPPPGTTPATYAPPDASDLPVTFTGGAFNPPQPDTLTLEF